MKTIRLLGTRNKVDFSLYLARTITLQGKRVLVVDATQQALYQWGITRLEGNDSLYEIDTVEVLKKVTSWDEVTQHVENEGETLESYDVVLVDIDNIDVMLGTWPSFDHSLYISDVDRYNITNDVPLINRYLDESKGELIRRIHIEGVYSIKEGYMDVLLNGREAFTWDSSVLEYDEFESKLRLMMQHDLIIPLHRLSKPYRQLLEGFVKEWLELHTADTALITGFSGFFGGLGRKSKSRKKELIGG